MFLIRLFVLEQFRPLEEIWTIFNKYNVKILKNDAGYEIHLSPTNLASPLPTAKRN